MKARLPRISRPVAGVAVMVFVLLASLAWMAWRSDAWLSDHWRGQLADSSDEETLSRLRAIGRFGAEGQAALLDQLSLSEPSTIAAWQVLREQLESWRELPAEEALSRRLRLAEALASRASQFSSVGREAARDLSQRISEDHPPTPGRETSRLLLVCEQVLLATTGRDDAPLIPPPLLAAEQEPVSSPKPFSEPARQADVARSTASAANRPAVLERTPTARALQEDKSPPAALPPDPAAQPLRNDALDNWPHSPRIGNRFEAPTSAEAKPLPPTTAELKSWTVQELLFGLRRSEAMNGAMNGAEAELRRRGFDDGWLQTAQRLNHAQAAVRVERLSELLRRPGIDPRPWLLWLAADEDASVRRAAMSRLITTGDPGLVARVVDLARDDEDPAVRELVNLAGKAVRTAETATDRRRR